MELKQHYKRLYKAQDEILNLLAKSSCYHKAIFDRFLISKFY
ncbi:hypothetical protein [Campylobacter gastrosuis]|uniref:Uncharacterized protein n=1 Tax=Campylobacter gastrosuis TaxID=2974576 RepID=A0ABT7HQQ0_9BACT|nr:hypothetical protein [Campylobacter gastrosuis]MDL0089236.1 hypothetical protein [Campylobacter gastrosuis]